MDRQDRQDDRRSELSMFICEAAVGLKPVMKLPNTYALPKNGDSFWPKRVSVTKTTITQKRGYT